MKTIVCCISSLCLSAINKSVSNTQCISQQWLLFKIIGVDGQTTVTIVSTPAGTPVSGSTNTFDYPILSSVNLTCMVDPIPSGTVIYSWGTSECYVNLRGDRNCFPAGQTSRTIIGNDLIAHDGGTITCSVSIDGGPMMSSESFTIRISGIWIGVLVV